MKIIRVKNKDDQYFGRHLDRLVREHGGKWIVIVHGRKFAIVTKSRLSQAMKKVRKKYPGCVPFMSPIPRPAEIQCLLKS